MSISQRDKHIKRVRNFTIIVEFSFFSIAITHLCRRAVTARTRRSGAPPPTSTSRAASTSPPRTAPTSTSTGRRQCAPTPTTRTAGVCARRATNSASPTSAPRFVFFLIFPCFFCCNSIKTKREDCSI